MGTFDRSQLEASITVPADQVSRPTIDAQEPVAWITEGGDVTRSYALAVERSFNRAPLPLYLAPPAPSGVWMRALRLADDAAESVICDAAESVICTEGHSPAAYHWVLGHEQIAADPYLEECIAHLEWRGIAKAVREDGRVTVIFEGSHDQGNACPAAAGRERAASASAGLVLQHGEENGGRCHPDGQPSHARADERAVLRPRSGYGKR